MKYPTGIKVGGEGWVKYTTCSSSTNYCPQCKNYVAFQIWCSPLMEPSPALKAEKGWLAPRRQNFCEDCLIKFLDIKIDKPEDLTLYITIEEGLIVVNAQLRNPPEVPGQRYFLFGQEVFRAKVELCDNVPLRNEPAPPVSHNFYITPKKESDQNG